MEDSISIDLDLEENVFSCSSSSSSLHPNSENEGNISDVYSKNGQNERDMSDVSSTMFLQQMVKMDYYKIKTVHLMNCSHWKMKLFQLLMIKMEIYLLMWIIWQMIFALLMKCLKF